MLIARLPDTPRWYLMRGRRDDARSVLERAGVEDVDGELDLIDADMRHEERGTFRELFSAPFTKAGVFVLGLGFFVQITGINGIVYYTPTMLKDVGFWSDTDAILGAALVQLAGLAFTVAAIWLIDRWGRRPVLLTGLVGMVVANAVLVVAFLAGESAALSVVGILLFVIGFNFGFGVTVWAYSSESLPARLRSVGASVLLGANLTANLIIGLEFLTVFNALGGAALFAIFGALSLAAIAFVGRLAPETKGRELEEIRGYWENDASWPEPAARTGRFARTGERVPTESR